jgi:3-dehydroquinate dehydratase-2
LPRSSDAETAAAALPIAFHQTSSETQLIEWVRGHRWCQRHHHQSGGIFIQSLALLDAPKMFPTDHRSASFEHPQARALYHRSLVSFAATAVIAGLGADGYPTAVEAIIKILSRSTS